MLACILFVLEAFWELHTEYLLYLGEIFVGFTIWQRGDVVLSDLNNKLRQAVKHALCDVITEHRKLVPPLCRPVPEDVLSDAEEAGDGKDEATGDVTDDTIEATPETPKAKLAFSLSIVSDFFRQTSSVASTPQESSMPALNDVANDEPGLDPETIAAECEAGERGHLHEAYTREIMDWFSFCQRQGTTRK